MGLSPTPRFTKPEEQAPRLREFLQQAGYSAEGLKRVLHEVARYMPHQHNLPRLLWRTREPVLLHLLIRWFFIGVPVEESLARKVVPEACLRLFLETGLLRARRGELAGSCHLALMEGLFVASDFPADVVLREAGLVTGVEEATRVLLQFALRKPVNSTLDLCAGSGALSLAAAAHSRRVLAADISPRATALAQFGAQLNGLDSRIECRTGDGFEPAGQETFDRIFANPPFFITPSSLFVFRDNELLLDEFCRRLIRAAPRHLNEGGHLQMLLEWVEFEGQPWRERLQEWFDGLGCDAWLLQWNEYEPPEYAQRRLPLSDWNAPERDAAAFSEWMRYYRRHRVRRIYGGLLALRRRSGRNWVRLEEGDPAGEQPFGESVLEGFEVRDVLAAAHREEELAALRPRIPGGVRLEQVYRMNEGRWEALCGRTVRENGFAKAMDLDEAGMAAVSLCDGSLAVAEIAARLAEAFGAEPRAMLEDCAALIRRLAEKGFLTLERGSQTLAPENAS